MDEARRRFETIVGEVYEPLQRYLRRRATIDDADDVLGDVLLTVWRRLDSVPDDAILPWCYGVARRSLANTRRSAQRRLRLVERLQAQPPAAPARDPAVIDDNPALTTALAVLPEDDREVLRLWAWEQLEAREIAAVFGISSNAAAIRLSRAKKRLAAALRRQDPIDAGHVGSVDTGEGRR